MTLKGWEITFHYPDDTGKKRQNRFMSGSLLSAACNCAVDVKDDLLILRKDLFPEETVKDFTLSSSFHIIAALGKTIDNIEAYVKNEAADDDRKISEVLDILNETKAISAVRVAGQQAAVFLEGRFDTEKTSPDLCLLQNS